MPYIGRDIESITFNSANNLNVVGNITLSGTVDGRDVAADGTKLDTVATNAIANLSEDTTPQLGGNLDLNTNNVIGTGNINVTGSITGTSFVSTGDMSFTNNSKAKFGTSPSLEIYHDGSNSILDDVGAGNFKMQLGGADKLEVTSTGVTVTGVVAATSYTGSGANLTGINTDLVSDTSPQLGGDLQSNGNDIVIADTDNIYVGTSNDGLKIHHSNNNSFIEDVGTGNFLITTNGNNIQLMKNQAEQMLVAKTDGSVELYYDNAKKLETTSSGVDVTGTAVVDGLTCSGTTTIEGTSTFGTSSADTRFNFDGPNQYRAVFKSSGTIGGQIGAAGADDLRFSNAAGSTVASIKDGNLLVGKTSSGTTTAGFETQSSGLTAIVRDSNTPLYVGRNSNDGDIVVLRKDGTTVGSIGAVGTDVFLASPSGNDAGIRLGNNIIRP